VIRLILTVSARRSVQLTTVMFCCLCVVVLPLLV